jgi:hypothetical protein
LGRVLVVLDHPRIGKQEAVQVELGSEQHQGARRVAIAERDDAAEMRCGFTEGNDGGGDVIPAFPEAAVGALAVADAPPVEAKHRIPTGCDARGEFGLSRPGARADFVAAADDEQAGLAFGRVERAEQLIFQAVERQYPAGHPTASARCAASATAR